FLNEWECTRPPVIQLAIRGKDRHPESWQGDGNISLDRTDFRGQWMNSATAKVHFADGAVTFQDFRITRDEGLAPEPSLTISPSTKSACRTSKQPSGQLKRLTGSIRICRKRSRPTNFISRRRLLRTVFTNSVAEPEPSWRSTSMRQAGWTTFFWERLCRSIESRRVFFSPTTGSRLLIFAADFLPETCAAAPTARWRAATSIIEQSWRSMASIFRV